MDPPLLCFPSSSPRRWETREKVWDHSFPLPPNQIQVPAYPPRPPEPGKRPTSCIQARAPSDRKGKTSQKFIESARGGDKRNKLEFGNLRKGYLDPWDLLDESRCSSGVGKGTGTEHPQLLDCSGELPAAHLRATTGHSCAKECGGGLRTWTFGARSEMTLRGTTVRSELLSGAKSLA